MSPTLAGRSLGELIALRRYLFDELVRRFHLRTLPDTHHILDDALTACIITSIAPSEQSVESSLQYWLVFLKFITQKMNLHIDAPGLSDEDREERHRLWWAVYIIDRHSALSFNNRPCIPDKECHQLPTPCSDLLWNNMGPLFEGLDASECIRPPLGYDVQSLDIFGVFLPLSKILGEILEYHSLLENSPLNADKNLLHAIRETIEIHLGHWYRSFKQSVGLEFCDIAQPEPSSAAPTKQYPKVAYYGLHMYHCMFILLYGLMDVVRMYEDLEWQASSDFIIVGEHAMACASVAKHILLVDPQLLFMYRYFGTYLLQSSFIFLILAQKLGHRSDTLILGNCSINLQVLDTFVKTTNMDYQRTFAKLLRKVLSSQLNTPDDTSASPKPSTGDTAGESATLDPEMLRYRWTAGHRGLWANSVPGDLS
ncbi:hypothetical protein ASPZODRAFT_55029 [Penicilliopsis zonata CBS 506.65]|uniref:Xylanolytic transcriptional activator regulatory domain-containing protein n=1 Tax=Penicilliopsis zonata CBS 506.65 TaxID=1073090 RepID=A0A1L9STR7_9EURO|nr:hypothetical protein ASPZODRAFT_55029 [Penicilliopsis zonata CBS 506.65]OJJ50600.1 hypothetical protein ASPZODRAFT_55029 [Penicilliopsis zonata CBS 506.65]